MSMLLEPIYNAFLRARGTARVEISNLLLEVFAIPEWRLRTIGKVGAFIVFTDSTAWIGHGTSKYIKDKLDYGLEDNLKQLSPIEPGTAKSIAVKRLPAKYLIVANIYDERKLTSKESFKAGFSAAINEAAKLGVKSIAVVDPTDDWNYYEHRVNGDYAMRLILSAILQNRKRLSNAKIIVPNAEYAPAYECMIHRLSEDRWKYCGEEECSELPSI